MINKRVLLIDDNEDTRTMVKFALEMNAVWKVLTADSAIEGITIAETERPDIVLLDLAIPQLDGLTTYEILKANLFTCSIPIVFITAHTQEKIISQLETTLAEGIITKPFDLASLELQISEICNC
ncbi:MAG: response regulator [Cyanobacteria bacterium J06582_2]